jgi:hypothetical protein
MNGNSKPFTTSAFPYKSPLFKDAYTVRKAVFVVEQEYLSYLILAESTRLWKWMIKMNAQLI